MIKIVERITASAIWDVEGTEVRLTYRKEFPEPVMADKIRGYREILTTRAYEQDNKGLCEAFLFFGGIAFVAVGMSCRDDFLTCFAYYAKQFAAEWAAGDKCLKAKFVGYGYVFANMLRNENVSIKYDFRYILDGADGDPFCQLNEKAFAEHWISAMLPLMANGLSLANVAERVGDVRVSKYLMQTPEQTELYLKRIAAAYTARRELISFRKISAFIFGSDSRANFAGEDNAFLELLRRITEEEIEIQKVRFIAEHRKEMSLSKDVWVLYQRHGAGLKFLTVDFTAVAQTSLRYELKHFLKNRFSAGFRTSDRTYIPLFDAISRLCAINPPIRYFADIDDTDVKNLHLSMEQQMTQSQIMTEISALKTLFSYLCSDENNSSAPKPFVNPFDRLRFVNAGEYHEGSTYIPDMVWSPLLERLNELNETDRLIFEIFSETGMRAKEVAFLEADCLTKARYGDGNTVLLKFIPYKTLKAHRRNGLSDYHDVYIPVELAEKIQKQIAVSAALREEYNLPYIFLHQHKGYKVKMLDVQYFIAKINMLIKKYNICDESGQLWHFTSRQCRKTMVVNMIENGATAEDLTFALSHLNQATASKYYNEVRKRRLAELNTEFYQKAFDVRLSQDQLSSFSEEERRMLYVDFRLGNRRVELGFCTRKLCEGACKSRSRTVHCVNCPQLCTGVKYLPYWGKLLQAQRERVRALIIGYQNAEIEDYEEFIEYKQEQRMLAAYKNIVVELEKSEVSKP